MCLTMLCVFLSDVMGPDDWHPNVNNNAYTNVIASRAIHWARYMACICGRSERTEVYFCYFFYIEQ